MSYRAIYRFLATNGKHLETVSGDAISAFCQIKKESLDNYFKLRRYEKGQLAPDGYAKLDIGYGLSVAWTREPIEQTEST